MNNIINLRKTYNHKNHLTLVPKGLGCDALKVESTIDGIKLTQGLNTIDLANDNYFQGIINALHKAKAKVAGPWV